MRFTPSPLVVKQSLASHAWIGLLVSALMYLVCLTGTVAVFYPEFERWEQPQVEEFPDINPDLIDKSFADLIGNKLEPQDHINIAINNTHSPRLIIATSEMGWHLNQDGSLGEKVDHGWTKMLVDLHLYLHLPKTFGLLVVSALGALLVGLIISGFVSHPKIIRDAFSFRLGGSRHLEQVDIHNRLSVWASPFHLMIAFTGAYFGFVIPIMGIMAYATGQDQDKVIDALFGEDPVLEQIIEPLALGRAITQTRERAPEGEIFYATVHDYGTANQFIEVRVLLPQRLIYSENYVYDQTGRFLNKGGFSDGEASKQFAYSIYRLHFGHFGGWQVKILFGILGLTLTIIAATGVNIWLAKRRTSNYWNDLWAAMVWGSPLALTTSAFSQVILGFSPTSIFWLTLIAAGLYCLRSKSPEKNARNLRLAWAVCISSLLISYGIKYGTAAFSVAALPINLGLIFILLLLVLQIFFGNLLTPINATSKSLSDNRQREIA